MDDDKRNVKTIVMLLKMAIVDEAQFNLIDPNDFFSRGRISGLRTALVYLGEEQWLKENDLWPKSRTKRPISLHEQRNQRTGFKHRSDGIETRRD